MDSNSNHHQHTNPDLKFKSNSSHHQQQEQEEQESSASPSPLSSSSSPSHDFSFTISLHSSISVPEKSKPDIDFSPADDIFFHGHLLPLQLLSHLHSCSSSRESFSLPIREFTDEFEPEEQEETVTTTTPHEETHQTHDFEPKPKSKPKSKSFRFGFKSKEKKEGSSSNHGNKQKFDVGNLVKKYMRMVKPFLFTKDRKLAEDLRFEKPHSYSFSGRTSKDMRRRRGELSAPASMRTSPSSSGHLVVAQRIVSPASDSTMEELQSAIQAAIAHCKNSIATQERLMV